MYICIEREKERERSHPGRDELSQQLAPPDSNRDKKHHVERDAVHAQRGLQGGGVECWLECDGRSGLGRSNWVDALVQDARRVVEDCLGAGQLLGESQSQRDGNLGKSVAWSQVRFGS